MLNRIIGSITLPPEITAFERQYLARTHKIAKYFFLGHFPVFLVIAWANETGPMLAAILTSLVLVGPLVAERVLQSPRSMSVIYGVTAMLMGGILVHIGQGPMQIEMHFYFFVLLALLAVFADPRAIAVAAVTAAVHHLVLWLWLPASVFNYDAPVWVVGVHAAFVVLESIAACFIARSFFDNVIGLERIVGQRTAALDVRNQDLQRVLDHLAQGLVVVRRDGSLADERSRSTDVLLGARGEAQSLGAWVGNGDASAGSMLDLGLEQVFEELLPAEITLAQLPAETQIGERTLALSYTAVGAEPITGVLVMITDVSAERQRERLDAEQRELMSLVDHALRDRRAVAELLAEGTERIALLDPSMRCPPDVMKREVHTLKGNAAIFGVPSIAELCHALESAMVSESETVPGITAELRLRWARLAAQLQPLLERDIGAMVELDKHSYDQHVHALRARGDADELVRDVLRWPCEQVSRRLERLGEQAGQVARRLGKPVPRIVIDEDGLRLDPDRWATFWQSTVHVVRNAVDHGVESAEERAASGKPIEATLTLSCRRLASGFEIELADDGAGIDWARVAAKARAMNMADQTHEDLVQALFADGLSTKDEVTEMSGRGVGLGAVLDACRERGGTLAVESELGRGTRVVMRFPATERVTLQPMRRGLDGRGTIAQA